MFEKQEQVVVYIYIMFPTVLYIPWTYFLFLDHSKAYININNQPMVILIQRMQKFGNFANISWSLSFCFMIIASFENVELVYNHS